MGAKDLLLLSGTLLIYLNLPVFADTREQPNSPQMIFLEEPHKFDHIAQNSAASESSDHLTSVSQLSDVQPSD
jgi:hypothetical protein